MDSQHKHELKENDLKQFITHFGEWWGKHQTKVLLIAIVLAGTILGVRILNNRAMEKKDSTFLALNLETSPAGFKAIAADADSDSVRAIASLRAADLLLQEASMPSSSIADENAITPADRKARLEEARQLYNQAASASDSELMKLNAKMGIASVAESLGDWDEAVKVYESIKTSAGQTHPSFAAQADTRLAILPRVKIEPNFAPEPTPKKPDDAKTGDTKTGDSKTGDTKTGDSKTGETKSGDTKTGDSKTGDTKDATKSGDTKAPTPTPTPTPAPAPTKDGKEPTKTGDAKTTGDPKKAGDTKDGTKAP